MTAVPQLYLHILLYLLLYCSYTALLAALLLTLWRDRRAPANTDPSKTAYTALLAALRSAVLLHLGFTGCVYLGWCVYSFTDSLS